MIEHKTPFEASDRYLTPVQAATVLHVSLATLKKFIYSGRLRTLKTPGGHHRIFRQDLFALTEEEATPLPLVSFEDKTSLAIAKGLVSALEVQHPFCAGHAQDVAGLSLAIAGRMRLDETRQKSVRAAALLHDIGMLDIDKHLLKAGERLNVAALAVVKTHPTLGAQVVDSVGALRPLSHIILQHHERYDGAGYPLGLAADMICLESRIISLAEAYVSMTARSYYKNPIADEPALAEIKKNIGTQFSPDVVDAFLQLGPARLQQPGASS